MIIIIMTGDMEWLAVDICRYTIYRSAIYPSTRALTTFHWRHIKVDELPLNVRVIYGRPSVTSSCRCLGRPQISHPNGSHLMACTRLISRAVPPTKAFYHTAR